MYKVFSLTDEFDPKKNNDIEKGPLKSKHRNQYGTANKKESDRKLAERVPDKKK